MLGVTKKLIGEKYHRLFVRIFLHGLLLIVVVSVGVALVFALLGNTVLWRELPGRLGEELARDIVPGNAEQKKLTASLEKMQRILQADMAVYSYDGHRLAQAGAHPPPPVDDDALFSLSDRKILRHWGTTKMYLPIPNKLGAPPCYVIMDWPFAGNRSRLAIGLLTIVFLVGLMSIPVARALTRPLEKVTQTARQLAQGNLNARTKVVRKDEVGVLAATIDDMAGLLDRRIKGEKELLANVSHEIRTPLARIKVALELCNDMDGSEQELRKQLEGIAGDVNELEQLIEDVLTVARLDLQGAISDKTLVTVRKTWINPKTVAKACVDRFQSVHPAREIVLKMEEALPDLFLDEKLFRRALDNLLDNAVKYSSLETTVEFQVHAEREKVTFAVLDRGIGVAEEDVPNLFEPFYRSERSRSRKAGGTGLGLTLCKRIAEAHDAWIEVSPRPAGGTIFRIVISAGNKKQS